MPTRSDGVNPQIKGFPGKKRTNYRQARYDDAVRLAAITLANLTIANAAAKKLGLPQQTVDAWVKGYRSAASLQLWCASAGELANALHHAAWDILAAVNAKNEDAPLSNLMMGAKLATEAEKLLRNTETANQRMQRE